MTGINYYTVTNAFRISTRFETSSLFFFEKFLKSAKLNKCDIIGNAKAVLIIFFKARLTNVM